MLALLMMAQAAAAPPARIDLLTLTKPTGCKTEGPDGEVVVCAGRADPYRVRQIPVSKTSALPKAQLNIGNVKAAVETEQAGVGGFTSNRAMVRIKMPF